MFCIRSSMTSFIMETHFFSYLYAHSLIIMPFLSIRAEIQDSFGASHGGWTFAAFDFSSDADDELSFTRGERLHILRREDEAETLWWWAENENGSAGYVPCNYLAVSSFFMLYFFVFVLWVLGGVLRRRKEETSWPRSLAQLCTSFDVRVSTCTCVDGCRLSSFIFVFAHFR